MTYRPAKTVTQNGMTACQPGTSVSSTSPAYDAQYNRIAGARLNVSRYYPDLPNEFGGKGVFKKCDCDGMLFEDADAAHKFAFERGYLQEFRHHYLSARRAEILTARIARRLAK